MYTSITTPGLTANQHTGNGWDHLFLVEHPNAHIIFPSRSSSDYSLSRIIQHMNYTQVPNFDNVHNTSSQKYRQKLWYLLFNKQLDSYFSARVSMPCEMHTASFTIWTQRAESTSYDKNHYSKSASQ